MKEFIRFCNEANRELCGGIAWGRFWCDEENYDFAYEVILPEKVIALLGNHDEWVVEGVSSIDYMNDMIGEGPEEDDDRYIKWLSLLPKYHVEGNTIFVHAGIDEDAGDLWEWATGDDIFTMEKAIITLMEWYFTVV